MTTVHNYKALLAAAETAGREVCDERDQARDALRDAHAALDVEIGRGDKATGRVFTLAERINFALAGLHEETKRGDDAEDKVDRQAREIDRLKADLLLLGALKSEEVAPVIERFRAAFGADVPQAPSGKRALTFERAIQIGEKVHGLYPSEAAAVLLAEFGEPAKVVPPVRRARHDRHCMIHDGVGCSREPGCDGTVTLPRAFRSGRIDIGGTSVDVHVLPGGAAIVEAATVGALLGLPESGLGAFLASLPWTDRVTFLRSRESCSMCKAPASHYVRETNAKVCGKHRAWSEKRGIATREWSGRDVQAVGVPAEKMSDMLISFWQANNGTPEGDRARGIVRAVVKRGMRASGHSEAPLDFLMAAATPPRSK